MEPVHVLAVSGSLRRRSYNSALLRAAVSLAPDGMEVELFTGLRGLPHYDQDLEDAGPPPQVLALRDRIRRADGLLIATPEYNYAPPGVLKNLVDWASRPATDSCLRGKPVAVLGAAPGNFGTVRAQLALRESLLATDSRVVTRPEVMVFGAAGRFDDELRLTDEGTADLLHVLLRSLERLVRDTRAADAVVGT